MDANFSRSLSAFQAWANTQSPEFAAGINAIITGRVLDGLGEAVLDNKVKSAKDINPQVGVANQITSFIDTLGTTYLKTVDAYYTAKGKAADLQLKAQGSVITQATTAAGTIPPTNWLLIGGAALAAVVLLRRK